MMKPQQRMMEVSVFAFMLLMGNGAWGNAQADTGGALLTGAEIRAMVNGQRIYIAGPLGAELPVNYRTNGTVDGSGEAVGLGRFFQPKDKGRWWINGNQLCQQWEKWYDGTVMCFTLQKNGGEQLLWKRDNGESGTARLARGG